MARSKASTVAKYLAELPPERREVIAAVRDVVANSMPSGYVETMRWGMISYELPLERYAHTYNGQPLSYLALAAQKQYYALYLHGVLTNPSQEAWLREAFAQVGKKLDLGKGCLRFKRLPDLPLDVISTLVASTSPGVFIARYEASRKR
jgi:ribosomal protein S7